MDEAQDPRISAAIAAMNSMDLASIDDDHAAFVALLADDLVVNNPQNTLSAEGQTAELSVAGRISYSAYDRVIDYAGLRGDLVLILGGETCVPKAPHPLAGKTVKRRFLDLWKFENGGWLLTGRQASIISTAAFGHTPTT